ncbi:MAG: D-alanyl-D-alanine carboxypeptidase/D-alanyl-D-alanine-endopeptidase [Chitinophagaceae bacterium]
MNKHCYRNSLLLIACCLFFSSCSVSKTISRSAQKLVLENAALQTAHVGISVFDPSANTYLYNYQGDKYFIPASNTKIPTCYVAMKYLGKNLQGIQYKTEGDVVIIYPTGDPTFLHPDFERQRVFDFLKNTDKEIVLSTAHWKDEAWGSGWAWNDYSEAYMAERSAMPVYGNVVRFKGQVQNISVVPEFFNGSLRFDSSFSTYTYLADVKRKLTGNSFSGTAVGEREREIQIPFFTDNSELIYLLLRDTLDKSITKSLRNKDSATKYAAIHSQPTDSMLKPMMHRSDNFFAEQSLLMVSNELLGVMNDSKIIDTILKTDFKDLPQKPRWADGSGLSRYNLFTPQDFVAILNKMKNEFGMERLKEIFPTGNDGTLTNYYKADSNYFFAKTGTLSGVVALSGFMYTRKNKLLLFSVLVNNHQASATNVRRAVEAFLHGVRKKF